MASLTRSSLRISLVPFFTKTAIGTPQARWRETTQSGRFSIMPVMRFSPDLRHPLDGLDAMERALTQGVALVVERLVHGDEPLRRVAEDQRPLRAPGMRILVLQAPARDERADFDELPDHRLVGARILALVVIDALAREERHVGEVG